MLVLHWFSSEMVATLNSDCQDDEDQGTSSAAREPARADIGAPVAPVSIFDVRSPRSKSLILVAASIVCIMTPMTDTIYLPSQQSVAATVDGATPDTVAASVSAYMASLAVGALIWGPLSDRLGRKRTIPVSMAIYLCLTVGCIFAPNIGALIGLRASTGLVVAANNSITGAIIADTFAPHERGRAMAMYMLSVQVTPIVGPILGGALTAALDWRAPFMLLAAVGAVVLAVALVMPETHHWYTVKAREAAHAASMVRGADASKGGTPLEPIIEEQQGSIKAPVLRKPWYPIAMVLEPPLRPYLAVVCANFSSMFLSQVVFTALLTSPPYNIPTAQTGLLYLPLSVSTIVGTQVGGRLSDWAGRRAPGRPSARMLPNLLGSLLVPAGCLIYGLSFQYKLHLGAALFGHAVLGIGRSFYNPGWMAYVTSLKQQSAGAANAATWAFNFSLSAILISATVPLQASLGVGGLFALLASINLAATGWALADWRRAQVLALAAAAAGEASVPSKSEREGNSTVSNASAESVEWLLQIAARR